MAASKPVGDFDAEHIYKLLQCPVCLEKFKHPKVLPCQHTFCKGCLVLLYQAQLVTARLRHGSLRCPTCRTTHDVPSNGAEGFPVAVTVQGLLDAPQKQIDTAADDFCSVHERQQLNLYCEECREYICANCLVDGKHKEHFDRTTTMTDIERELQNVTLELQEQVTHTDATVANAYRELEEAEGQLQREIEAVEEEATAALSVVIGQFDEEKKKLNERYEAVCQEHEHVRQENLRSVRTSFETSIGRKRKELLESGAEAFLLKAAIVLSKSQSSGTRTLRESMIMLFEVEEVTHTLEDLPKVSTFRCPKSRRQQPASADLELEVVTTEWKESVKRKQETTEKKAEEVKLAAQRQLHAAGAEVQRVKDEMKTLQAKIRKLEDQIHSVEKWHESFPGKGPARYDTLSRGPHGVTTAGPMTGGSSYQTSGFYPRCYGSSDKRGPW